MVWVMDADGSIFDSVTGAPFGGSRISRPISGPVVTHPPTPAVYEDVSRIETIRELRRLVSESTISEPVGYTDGTYDVTEHGLAYMDVPRARLGIGAAKEMMENLERNGFKLVKVIK